MNCLIVQVILMIRHIEAAILAKDEKENNAEKHHRFRVTIKIHGENKYIHFIQI